mgnify:CR=1 FL=1
MILTQIAQQERSELLCSALDSALNLSVPQMKCRGVTSACSRQADLEKVPGFKGLHFLSRLRIIK